VNKPLVLLLDEPLSALDYQLRKNMQFELKNLQRELGITFILVTHDQEEALSMADRVAVMHHGRIEQLGTPREVYEEPKNLHVATFIGQANIFDTEVVEANDSQLVLSIEGTLFPLKNKRGYKKGDRVHMVLRPEDLSVWSEHEVDYTGSMLPAVVKQFIYKGSTVDLVLQLPSGTLLMASEFFDEDDENLEYSVGESVWVEWVPGWEVVLPYDKK
jgi:spermidine/putrescine transport system ATP-binding protein